MTDLDGFAYARERWSRLSATRRRKLIPRVVELRREKRSISWISRHLKIGSGKVSAILGDAVRLGEMSAEEAAEIETAVRAAPAARSVAHRVIDQTNALADQWNRVLWGKPYVEDVDPGE